MDSERRTEKQSYYFPVVEMLPIDVVVWRTYLTSNAQQQIAALVY